MQEAESNLSIAVVPTASQDAYEVQGRGELQLGKCSSYFSSLLCEHNEDAFQLLYILLTDQCLRSTSGTHCAR